MIIFLDIDGVLNQLQKNHIDEECVKTLAVLCRKTNGEVVLTSSWRKGYTLFGKCSPEIEKLKQYFVDYGIKIVGRTKVLNDRAEEILTYIKEHDVKSYIILDDDKSEFSREIDGIYIVNHKKGLTMKDIKKIGDKIL